MLDNYGTINKGPPTRIRPNLDFNGAIVNTGVIEANSGTLEVENSGTCSGGAFSAGSGATILLDFGNLNGTLSTSGAGSEQLLGNDFHRSYFQRRHGHHA